MYVTGEYNAQDSQSLRAYGLMMSQPRALAGLRLDSVTQIR